ncbi:hypothetical protein [Nocardioides perillae]|uniref:Uncharacterized protein n=1 Tax=Nocardioides perillae TaxID=1119534 RepID=A0A7Y9RPB9_9ACTN|nr:hypothetical protein [Nocardioides perillae]NYG53860.1 hypothetical protein [Nocardioides perillae]
MSAHTPEVGPSADGVPAAEGLDEHAVAEAVERDPESQRNHTDPAKEPTEDDTAPGRRGTEAHRRD